MFAYAPFMILDAPYESTMGLVQKIFYFHVPAGMTMFLAAFVSGIGSAVFLFTRKPWADRLAVAGAELAVVLGLIVLVTGPLWARKAWGVWWVWDPRVTSTLVMWLIFTPTCCCGATAARVGSAVGRRRALRHGQRAVRLLVGERLADAAPEDLRGAHAAAGPAGAVLVLRRGVPADRRRCS